ARDRAGPAISGRRGLSSQQESRVNSAKQTIRHIRARPVMVPFKRPPVAASGALPRAALVLIDLETNDGITRRSYAFGFSAWTLKPIVACVDALSPMLAGHP